MPYSHRNATEINPLRCNLVLFKQAVRSLHRNAIDSEYHEVLLRLRTPEGEIVSGGRLLTIAAQVKGGKLDRQIISLLFEYLITSGDERSFGVNLSAETITYNGEFFDFLIGEVERLQINPEQIVFEINENTAVLGKQEIASWLQRFQGLGFRFALDDFGIAHLNFLDVKRLAHKEPGSRPNFIKIDGQFVRDLADPVNMFLVRSIAGLADLSNALSVAECVEDAIQYQLLKTYGVDMAQGYFLEIPQLLYDPPIPVFPRLD